MKKRFLFTTVLLFALSLINNPTSVKATPTLTNSTSVSGSGATSMVLFLCLAILAVSILVQWKLFTKAGEKGWWALVPFANTYHLFKIVWGRGSLFWLLFLPIGNFVLIYATCYKLAKAYGKGNGFAIACLFFPSILPVIIALDKNCLYQGPQGKGKTAVIVATVLISVLYFVAIFLLGGLLAAMDNKLGETGYTSSGVSTWNQEDTLFGQESADSDCTYQTLTNDIVSVSVPALPDSVVSGSSMYGYKDGISLRTDLGFNMDDTQTVISETVDTLTDTYEMLDYSKIEVGDIFEGNGCVAQQISYEKDGTQCLTIINVKLQDEYPVTTIIEVDNTMATPDTKSTLNELCQWYHLVF